MNNYRVKISSKSDLDKQCKLQAEVLKKSGINIVTCGDCGDVMLVKRDEELHTCPRCYFQSDPCDFPDLYYN